MYEHVMSSQGVTSKVECRDGKQSRRTVLGSRWSLQGVVNPMIYQALKNWSISEHLNKLNADPLQSLFLIANTAADGDGNVDSVPQNTILNAQDSHAPPIRRRQNAMSQEATVNWNSVNPSSSAVSFQVGANAGQSLFPTASVLPDREQIRGTTIETPEANNSRAFPSSNSDDLVQQSQWWDNSFCDEIPAEVGTQATYSEPKMPRSGRVLAPITGRSSADAVDPDVLARERRAEQRREKNREAARRSNERNKVKREILKSKLQIERAKVLLLREKEMMLRKDNLELRRQFR